MGKKRAEKMTKHDDPPKPPPHPPATQPPHPGPAQPAQPAPPGGPPHTPAPTGPQPAAPKQPKPKGGAGDYVVKFAGQPAVDVANAPTEDEAIRRAATQLGVVGWETPPDVMLVEKGSGAPGVPPPETKK